MLQNLKHNILYSWYTVPGHYLVYVPRQCGSVSGLSRCSVSSSLLMKTYCTAAYCRGDFPPIHCQLMFGLMSSIYTLPHSKFLSDNISTISTYLNIYNIYISRQRGRSAGTRARGRDVTIIQTKYRPVSPSPADHRPIQHYIKLQLADIFPCLSSNYICHN